MKVLFPDSPQWPLQLDRLSRPPTSLWLEGQIEVSPHIGIVGSRRATESACDFAFSLARELAATGISIVSGAALGIDAAAHWGALDANGPTVAVLGCGIAQTYPRANRRLFEALRSKGSLLSEYPPNATPRRGTFIARNRLIAGLCDALVVVEAPSRSGAWSTARIANQIQIPLFVVPHSPWNQHAYGNLEWLSQSKATPLYRAKQIFDALQIQPPAPTTHEPALSSNPLLRHLSGEWISEDLLLFRTNMNAATLLATLTQLEAEQQVQSDGLGRWRRCMIGELF